MTSRFAVSVSALVARLVAGMLRIRIVRAALLYAERRGPQLADAVTYRALFSVFAGLMLGFSAATLWLAGNPVAWQALVDAVDAAVPGLVGEGGIVDPRVIPTPAGLTVTGALAFVGLVAAAIGAIGSLRASFRVLGGDTADDGQWYWVLVRNLLLAVGIGAALAASAAATFLGTLGARSVLSWLGVPDGAVVSTLAPHLVSIVVVFVLDTAAVAVLVRALAGIRPAVRVLWSGAVLGGVGLTALQQLSSLFVGGAAANPLLASFASLVALLLWFNLSAQVILFSCAYVVTAHREHAAPGSGATLPTTFAQRRVLRAEEAVAAATRELEKARAAAS